MSRNLHDLIAVAAEMRAVGYAWEAVADKVHRKPETCQKWPARHAAEWERVYRAAQLKRFDDLHNEVGYHLNQLLRDGDKKVKAEAIKVWMRAAPAAFSKHRELVGPPPDAPEERITWADVVAQDRERLDAHRAAAGYGPASDYEFQIWYRQRSQGWHPVKCDDFGNLLPPAEPANAEGESTGVTPPPAAWGRGSLAATGGLVVGLMLAVVAPGLMGGRRAGTPASLLPLRSRGGFARAPANPRR